MATLEHLAATGDRWEGRIVRVAFRWMTTNAPLLILSLILGVLAWIVAVEESDPTREELFPQAIPVTLVNLPEGMTIVEVFDEEVEVTVRAPDSVWNSLKVDDFAVTADLTELGTGTREVPIGLVLDKYPSRVTQVEPEHITVVLQPEAEQTVPVRVEVEGEPTLGYFKRASVVNPREVKVSGPSTYVARVVEVATQVSVEDATADIEGKFLLQPLDSEGQPVPYVKLTVGRVDVRIPIELSTYYRPLAVKVTLEGQIAYGYRITEISVDPPSVTASGLPSVIAALPGFIETEPISIEGARADVVERPALNIPSDVSVVMDEQPVVRVSIEAIQSSLTVVITPQIQGLDPGYTTTISPETVEVILSGPLPVLETLEDGDVRILLDLFGLPPETHQIEPQIVVPEGVTAQSINPATIQVEVAIAPTPTPTED